MRCEVDVGSYRPVSAPPRLLELQALDSTIDRLGVRRGQLEGAAELAEARTALEQAEARLGELKLTLDAVSREQRRLESDIDSLQRKVDAERARLYDGSVANPKELQSIEHEVQGILSRKSRIEDQLLERMEEREELEGKVPGAEAEASTARAHVAQIESTTARELVEVTRQLEERAGEREAVASGFEPEVLDLYEDLRRQKHGVGAAALVNGVCQGCHQQLSPVYLDRLKRTDGVWRCEHCRRILIVP